MRLILIRGAPESSDESIVRAFGGAYLCMGAVVSAAIVTILLRVFSVEVSRGMMLFLVIFGMAAIALVFPRSIVASFQKFERRAGRYFGSGPSPPRGSWGSMFQAMGTREDIRRALSTPSARRLVRRSFFLGFLVGQVAGLAMLATTVADGVSIAHVAAALLLLGSLALTLPGVGRQA